MPPPPYATMIKAKDQHHRFDLRRRLVADAKEIGIKQTSRCWCCSRNTVRLWLRRFNSDHLEGLKEHSHAPRSCPHKTPPETENRIIALRKRTAYGARRLKMEFDLSPSADAISRILRQHGLTRKPKTKRLKKNDLRRVKAALRAFQTVHMDVKYLNDIPHYLPQMRLRGLPKFQYTIRDVRTGLLFLAYADELSKTHACAAVSRFLQHLRCCGVKLPGVTIQTDNGAEFDGQLAPGSDRGFLYLIEDFFKAAHRFIPPGCSNANSDVETTHNLIETEFYEREHFRDLPEFLAKAWTYQCHFNFTRKNSYQHWKTPLERLHEAAPKIPTKIALLAPALLDNLLPAAPKRRPRTTSDQLIDELPAYAAPSANPPQGGQHQPGHPAQGQRIFDLRFSIADLEAGKSKIFLWFCGESVLCELGVLARSTVSAEGG